MKKIAIVTVFTLFTTVAVADSPETTSSVMEWIQAQANKVVVFQTKSWANGKAQLQRNKEQLTGFFNRLNLTETEEQ